MDETFLRNIMFWGEEAQNKISSFHVAIFGLGGVGGYCAEALARSGIGELTLIDFDKVSKSNINRQIVALHSTIGMYKTDLFKERLKDINPDIKLNIINDFYTDKFDFSGIHYVADAIDSMRSKVNLLVKCYKNKIPVISSMGAGNRINPEKLYITDISEIKDKKAPFVSNILYQLKKYGIESNITVVASNEKPFSQEKVSEIEKIVTQSGEEIEFNKIIPASTPFVASVAGIFMAERIVVDLLKKVYDFDIKS